MLRYCSYRLGGIPTSSLQKGFGEAGHSTRRLQLGPSVSFVLTRPSFAPCLVRGATHTSVQGHRRAASASPGDAAAVSGPSYPGDGRRRPGEPRRAPHAGLRSRGRGSRPRVETLNAGGRSPHASGAQQRHAARGRLHSSGESRPPGAVTPAPPPPPARPGRPAYLSGRRGGALHRGDVALHVGLAAPHRAADQAPRERQTGQPWGLRRLRAPGAERRTPVTQLRRGRMGTERHHCAPRCGPARLPRPRALQTT